MAYDYKMTYEEARKELIDFKHKSWDGMPEEVIDVAIKAIDTLLDGYKIYCTGGFTHSQVYVDTDTITISNSKVLKSCASMIKKECKKHQNCQDCPMFDRYKPEHLHDKTCPFFNSENPEDWLVN